MGTFEAARPGGSQAQALQYFNAAIEAGAQRSAGPLVAKAEGASLPAGNRAEFEQLLQRAIEVSTTHPSLANAVMQERAVWLLGVADDLF
jgi:predicted anti-sigma-YlaC factor YlaD